MNPPPRTAPAGRYANADPSHVPHRPSAVWKWAVTDRLLRRRRRRPPGAPAPSVRPDRGRIEEPGLSITWIGHSSFLVGLGGRFVAIDPVFSDRVGGVYRRRARAGLMPGDLPHLSAVLLTHAHYDHLDRPSIRSLPKALPLVVAAGMERYLPEARGRTIPVGWWDSREVEGLRITLVPARHWSRRGFVDVNRAWWGGFVVEGDGGAVYHAGDTGWFEGFGDIGARFPGMRAALLPIGGYDPAWFMEPSHTNPEQAGRAFLTLGAETLVPMHWGTFRLTDEPLGEPMDRLRRWWDSRRPAGRLAQLAIGETLVLPPRGTPPSPPRRG